jgi:hypothetical protein
VYGGDYYHGHWDDYYGGWWYGGAVATGVAVGEAVETGVAGTEAANAYAIGTVLNEEDFRSLSCTKNRTEVNAEIYYLCGVDWWRMAYVEGQYVYVVVQPPRDY